MDAMEKKSLEELRRDIARLDEDILGLLKKRISTAQEIGKRKIDLGLPVKDYRVEKKVFARNRATARSIDLYESLADGVSKLLIQYAVQAQDELRQRLQKETASEVKTILIVGGFGQMGVWLTQYFDAMGHKVLIHDSGGADADANAKTDAKTDAKTAPRPSTFARVPDLATGAAEADCIVIATPIVAAAAILRELIPLNPKGLIFDVCSLKNPIVPALQEAETAGLRVTSVHPMFGPSADILAGKNIVFCYTEGKKELSDEALSFFSETAATTVSLPIEQHDKLMSYVLGLSHLAGLIFADTLEASEFTYERFLKTASSTFNSQIEVVAPVVRENQDLYFEIQAENPHTSEIIAELEASLSRYGKAVKERDRDAFRARMEASRIYLSK